MKKVGKILLLVLVVLGVVFFGVYVYYGGLKTVNFQKEEQGGEILVYEDMVGDYAKTPEVMDSVYYTLLNKYGVETTKGFGIYYDNPQQVEKSQLRSEIGCILDAPLDSTKIAEISQRYKVKVFPKDTYVVTDFPNKGMMSVIIGLMKVYPALNKYMEENGLDNKGFVMEIYDVPNQKITYRKEIVK